MCLCVEEFTEVAQLAVTFLLPIPTPLHHHRLLVSSLLHLPECPCLTSCKWPTSLSQTHKAEKKEQQMTEVREQGKVEGNEDGTGEKNLFKMDFKTLKKHNENL